MDALHHVLGIRVGQQEGADGRHAEGPVHHPPRPHPVRHPATDHTEQAGRDRIARRQHAGVAHVHAIGAHQVVRQPKRQRHEATEHEEVVQREPPHLQVLQWRHLLGERHRLHAFATALLQRRVFLAEEEEQHRSDGQRDGPDLGDHGPAGRHHHQRRQQLGHRRADVAGTEDPQRSALLAGREPLRDVGHAHREVAAGDAHAQRGDQELGVGLCIGEHPGGHCATQHHQHHHLAATELVRPDAEEDPADRTGQHRGGDQQAELGVIQAKLLTDLDADDRKDHPHREAHGEGERAQPQRTLLLPGTGGGKGLVHGVSSFNGGQPISASASISSSPRTG